MWKWLAEKKELFEGIQTGQREEQRKEALFCLEMVGIIKLT